VKTLFPVAFFAITTLLVSCTTIDQVALSSNLESHYGERIDKLIVVIGNIDNVGRDNLAEQTSIDNYLKESIERDFIKIGIDTKVILFADVLSDNDEVESTRAAFGSKSIMVIERSRRDFSAYDSNINSATSPVTYTLDVSLSEAILEKRIWQSRIIVLGEFSYSTVDELMHDLISAMKFDGLVQIENDQIPTYVKSSSVSKTGLWISVLLLGGAVGVIYAISQLLLID